MFTQSLEKAPVSTQAEVEEFLMWDSLTKEMENSIYQNFKGLLQKKERCPGQKGKVSCLECDDCGAGRMQGGTEVI